MIDAASIGLKIANSAGNFAPGDGLEPGKPWRSCSPRFARVKGASRSRPPSSDSSRSCEFATQPPGLMMSLWTRVAAGGHTPPDPSQRSAHNIGLTVPGSRGGADLPLGGGRPLTDARLHAKHRWANTRRQRSSGGSRTSSVLEAGRTGRRGVERRV